MSMQRNGVSLLRAVTTRVHKVISICMRHVCTVVFVGRRRSATLAVMLADHEGSGSSIRSRSLFHQQIAYRSAASECRAAAVASSTDHGGPSSSIVAHQSCNARKPMPMSLHMRDNTVTPCLSYTSFSTMQTLASSHVAKGLREG